MNSQQYSAAARGLEFAGAMYGAYQDQAYAAIQAGNMQRQMEEIEARTKMELVQINLQSEKVVANQQAAFISGGVELSGSAMSVVSDTLNDAAQAAYIRRREADYDLGSLAIEKAQYKSAASSETLMLKIAAAGVGTVANHYKDKYNYNRGAPGKLPQDEWKTPQSTYYDAYNSTPNRAQGLA